MKPLYRRAPIPRSDLVLLLMCIIASLLWPSSLLAESRKTHPSIVLLRASTKESIDTGYDSIVRELAKDAFGWTPLMLASAGNRDPEVIRLLIRKGESVAARSLNGWTALMFAAAFNPEPAIVEVLIEAFSTVAASGKETGKETCGIECRSNDSWSSLYGAARYTGKNLRFEGIADVTAMTDGGLSTAAAARGWTALFFAARFNREPAVVDALLAAGADAGAQDEQGRTPLYYAKTYNPESRVSALLDTHMKKTVTHHP